MPAALTGRELTAPTVKTEIDQFRDKVDRTKASTGRLTPQPRVPLTTDGENRPICAERSIIHGRDQSRLVASSFALGGERKRRQFFVATRFTFERIHNLSASTGRGHPEGHGGEDGHQARNEALTHVAKRVLRSVALRFSPAPQPPLLANRSIRCSPLTCPPFAARKSRSILVAAISPPMTNCDRYESREEAI